MRPSVQTDASHMIYCKFKLTFFLTLETMHIKEQKFSRSIRTYLNIGMSQITALLPKCFAKVMVYMGKTDTPVPVL